jgi:hypothetical protein
MDALGSPAHASPSALTGQVDAALLRRSLDVERQQAAALLEALPPLPPLEPGRGRTIDVYA